ncbi:transcriptional regulator [Actinomadura logoneensis]|uniref:Transcriptional regulator n=1 Tax=Actinomadura logoneensis TaxID=2293572 RepID=A0A372JSZ0_9ACTN|nr:helix-turn-helix domain-containing protein [Actinomadura logoneensis]RFU43143.1 transcriptional regulator [Actinomadura logoneensis]
MAHQTVGHPGQPGLPDDPHTRVAEPTPSCPVEITLAALRGRWTTLVIRELLRGERTYSELRQALPALSDKVLSERLAHLSGAGVLTRRRTAGWPPSTHYALTDRGRDLGPVLQALWNWGSNPPPPSDAP